jgi:hypothetical protein
MTPAANRALAIVPPTASLAVSWSDAHANIAGTSVRLSQRSAELNESKKDLTKGLVSDARVHLSPRAEACGAITGAT